MLVETYKQADKLLAGIPVERRGRYRDDLYEAVAKRKARQTALNRARPVSVAEAATFAELAALVAEVVKLDPASFLRRGRVIGGAAHARRVLTLAAIEAMPRTTLLALAVLFRRPGQYSTVIFWRDSATETERAEANAVVNHWRVSHATKADQ